MSVASSVTIADIEQKVCESLSIQPLNNGHIETDHSGFYLGQKFSGETDEKELE